MNKDKAFENALDLMIDEALTAVNEKDCQLLASTSEVSFSEEHEAKMQQLFKKANKSRVKNSFIMYAKRAACVCLVALVLASVSICSVKAWRTKFIKLIYQEDAPNSDVFFSDSAAGSYTDENVTLSYLPQGFELTRNVVTSKGLILYFLNGDLFLSINIRDLDLNFNTDTEDASIEQLTIQGYDAVGIFKDDLNQIIWNDDEKSYHVSGNLTEEEIEKISKNLKKN